MMNRWQAVVRTLLRNFTAWMVVLGMVGATAQAATETWIAGSGNFTDNTNWDIGNAPNAGDGTAFTNNTSYTVSFPSAPSTPLDSNVVNGGTVTLNIESQTWTVTNGPVAFDIAQNAGTTATVVQTSGILTVYSSATNAEFVVGDFGVGSYTLNGGTLSYSSIRVGNNAGASGTFTVSGAGVTAPNPNSTAGTITVGTAGGSAGCSLIINNGASITTGATTIGGNSAATNTTAQVSGGAYWEMYQRPLSVGGFSTTFIVNNSTINDAGTFLVGTSGGVLDTAIITNNAFVYAGSGNLRVGNGNGTYSNQLIISGNATLNCDNAGTVKAIIIGASGFSSNNTVLISTGGMITNCASITVGDSSTMNGGNFNNLIVNNGGQLYLTAGVNLGHGVDATGNVWQVGGPGSPAIINTGSSTIGANTNAGYNAMIVTNASLTTGSLFVGNAFGAGSNSCLVEAGTFWSFTNLDLVVGRSGAPSNLMTVVGGVITNLRGLTVGLASGSTGAVNNTFIQTGGAVNSGSLTIGDATNDDFNTLTVSGGSLVVTGGVQVGGVGGFSLSNTLAVAGGEIMLTSLRVRTTNFLVFTAGTLNTGGTTIDSGANDGAPVVVGNGTSAANLQLTTNGASTGFHIFNNGLVITNNGVLSGIGTLMGEITVLGSVSPGYGVSVGTITMSNDLVLGSSAILQYALGSASDEIIVSNNLTLAGTLNVTSSGGFGTGIYPLFTYGGTLANPGGLSVNNPLPGGFTGSIDTTSEVGVVNLDVTSAPSNPFVTWQDHYFTAIELGNPSYSGPNADPLGKGMSNTNQFLAGFNPTNAAAYLHIITIAKINNNTDINVTYLGANGDSTYTGGPAIRTNVLEFTTGTTANGSYTNNFASTGQTNILSGGTGLGVVTNMVDSGGATNKPSRYYRVRVLLP